MSLSALLWQGRIALYSIDPLGTADFGGRAFRWEAFVKGISRPSQSEWGDLALQVIATQSGGLALTGSNDITASVKQSLADTDAYSYTEPPIFERFQPIKASAEDLAQYAGDYASNELQATYRFRVKEQTLTLTINSTELPSFFSPSLRDEFHAPDDTAIVFRRDAAGHIVGCDVYTDRVRKISLARK